MPRLALPEHWDEETDVVVVGCGYAGAVAAIAAHDAGARVILVEKMREPGGISVCSAGGVRVADDAEAAFEYLRETNGGATPDALLRRLATGMTAIETFVRTLGHDSNALISRRAHAGNYPFAGHRTFGFVYVDDIPGVDAARLYPHVRGSKAGALLFHVLQENLGRRSIEVRTETPARRLFADAEDVVRGVQIESSGRLRSIRAKRGVVLTCGGFEANADMQAQFWQGKPVLSAAVRGNTGDGIRMAQELGADLWHMWHYHGSYGFQHPDPAYPYGIRTKRLPDWLPGEGPRGEVVMTWIVVDRAGRRFMNEYPPYLQDTGARPLEPYDADRQRYGRIPCWLITDEAGRKRYPLGRPTYNDPDARFDWSADNAAEIELGIVRRAAGIEELAGIIDVDADVLGETLARWNRACARQSDPEFGRPPSSMMAIAEPPFYAAQLWPVVSNTQGGPRHDEHQRIVGPFGAPIPRLYAAGELGSVFGHLYMSGGNLAECFIGGRIAGREAAGETSA
ncbi:MAG TPA: FAD-dependent oxidoreductase [Stellaceae bacterium]|nr:FAD-dependent oxidoreductase [Stellaceae bacterium]